MADNETEEKNLAFYESGTPMGWSQYQSYHEHATKQEVEYLRIKKIVEAKIANGEPIFCQIMDARRKGSVGKITSIKFDYQASIPSKTNSYWSRGQGARLCINDLEISWDGRKNKVKPFHNEVELLLDWDPKVGTIWEWTQTVKEPEETVIAYDHLGQQIEIGQNVCFVHRKYGNIDMMFGTVTRMTKKGGVFIKRLKLRDRDRVEEVRALHMSDIIIINDSLMSRLVMARLAAQ